MSMLCTRDLFRLLGPISFRPCVPVLLRRTIQIQIVDKNDGPDRQPDHARACSPPRTLLLRISARPTLSWWCAGTTSLSSSTAHPL